MNKSVTVLPPPKMKTKGFLMGGEGYGARLSPLTDDTTGE